MSLLGIYITLSGLLFILLSAMWSNKTVGNLIFKIALILMMLFSGFMFGIEVINIT